MNKFKTLINYLKKHHLILATAESCTAGEIMATLANQGDCGDCLFMGYVVYSSTAKKKELGVKQSTIDKYTLTSEEVAQEMVKGIFQHEEINVALATTGITGDKSMDGIPPGTICMAWGFKNAKGEITIYSETKLFTGTSKKICKQAVNYILSKLELYHQCDSKG